MSRREMRPLPYAVYRQHKMPERFAAGSILNENAPELGYASYAGLLEFAVGKTALINRINIISPRATVNTVIYPTETYWKKLLSRYWNEVRWRTDDGSKPVNVQISPDRRERGLAELMIVSGDPDTGLLLNLDTVNEFELVRDAYGKARSNSISIEPYKMYVQHRQLQLYGLDDEVVV